MKCDLNKFITFINLIYTEDVQNNMNTIKILSMIFINLLYTYSSAYLLLKAINNILQTREYFLQKRESQN